MVLTPDQKKRIAALDSSPAQLEEEEPQPVGPVSARLKGLGLKATPSQISSAVFKILIILVVVAIAAYLIIINDLHKIRFGAIFESGPGGPIKKLSNAVRLQREKAELWEKGQGSLLEGEYQDVIKIAKEISGLDPDDSRSQELVDDTTIAVTHKAGREFESGEIEEALKSVRFALEHKPDYGPAKELILEISDRLLVEALAHSKKKEYSQLIIKSKEVLDIDSSNMTAFNLLMETNNELLDSADEYYLLRQYTKALEKVMLAMAIDPTNSRSKASLESIVDKVAAPKLEFYSTATIHGKVHARIKVPGEKPKYLRKGQSIKNYKVTEINLKKKEVRLRQINTGEEITLNQIEKTD
jgi:tetratricopeptide (TPR) repeat protein